MTTMQRCLLIAILLFTAATRLYDMTNYPAAFGQDEIVVGYDAYCLLHTLRDHHGEFLPLMPRMFNDYLSGVQTYWTIPFVAILGLTEQAVRLACSLPNIAAVFLMFLLARRLFKSVNLALWASFVITIAPWHLFFSRWAVQPNFVPFFLLLFLMTFFKAMDSPAAKAGVTWAILAGITLVLLAQVYPAQMFFAPLLAAVLGLVYLRRRFMRLLVMAIVALLGMLPFMIARLHRPASFARFHKETILFSHDFPALFWTRYSEYLSPSYLFEPLHNQYWQQFPGTAYFPIFLAPFFALGLFGVFFLIFSSAIRPESLKEWLSFSACEKLRSLDLPSLRRGALLVLFWLVLAPVPAALFEQTDYTTRAIQLFPAISMVMAMGLVSVAWLTQRVGAPLLRHGLVLIFAVATLFHLKITCQAMRNDNDYFKETMQQGLQEAIEFLQTQSQVADVFLEPLNQAYIYYLFYAHIDPHTLDTSEVSPPPPATWEEWRYLVVPRVRNYHFEVPIDLDWLQAHAVLRHQIKDKQHIWFNLYEDTNHRWYVVHAQPAVKG